MPIHAGLIHHIRILQAVTSLVAVLTTYFARIGFARGPPLGMVRGAVR